MAILYYGPKGVFLMSFSQMLTDLDEIRQDLLLISLIPIFVTLLVKAFRNSVNISQSYGQEYRCPLL